MNPNHDPKNGEFTSGAGVGSEQYAREPGQEIGAENLDSMSRAGHFYRGMTSKEYDATVGAGLGVKSDLRGSLKGEGTNFSNSLADAESYANYGRDDPRKTGDANYLVEVRGGPDITAKSDGYFHSQVAIPQDRVTRAWSMFARNGGIIMKRVI
jgi:hypothetical protein